MCHIVITNILSRCRATNSGNDASDANALLGVRTRSILLDLRKHLLSRRKHPANGKNIGQAARALVRKVDEVLL